MGNLNKDEVKVKVTGIIPYQNESFAGVKILWSGNIGCGEYEIYATESDKRPVYQNCPDEDQDYKYVNLKGLSEHMDDKDDKWFIKLLLSSLVDQIEIGD